ncbi:MAG: hypothetical protein M3Y59_03045 [Myxococcota bacterium]|nr:hypothetical protein [Myxococcota bacterium]
MARSRKSLAAYARELGLNVQRLHYWRKRGSAFEAVSTAQPPTFATAIIRSPAAAVATLWVGAEMVLEIEDPSAVPAEGVAAFALAVSER